jgi:hypothetical protein
VSSEVAILEEVSLEVATQEAESQGEVSLEVTSLEEVSLKVASLVEVSLEVATEEAESQEVMDLNTFRILWDGTFGSKKGRIEPIEFFVFYWARCILPYFPQIMQEE